MLGASISALSVTNSGIKFHKSLNWKNLTLTLQPPDYSIGIFTHLKLCLADAIHNFKWVKIIQSWQNECGLFSNLADYCHNLSSICLKADIVHGPDRVTVHPPQDSLRPNFYCSLDLPRYQKSMPSKKSWDGLPVLGHFQNGRHQNLEITFCAITWVLRQLESQNWCLCICFWGWGIQLCQ